MALIGWATEMKTASADLIQKRILRTGGLNNNSNDIDEIKHSHENQVWGWDDPEMLEEDKKFAMVLNKTIVTN
jgi:hypothetical protein